VPRPTFPRTLAEFHAAFPNQDSCVLYLAQSRWPEGFVCPRCGRGEAYRLPKRGLWQCKSCGYQTSPTAGTVLHRSRVPLRQWFEAAYLVSTLTPGVSAVQLQRQLGLATYETAWTMLHRLRRAMLRPERDRLTGPVEIDESFVGGVRAGTPGRGAGGKTLIVGAVEARGEGSGRVRLATIPDASRATLEAFVRANVVEGGVIFTDGWAGYENLKSLGYDHRPRAQGGKRNPRNILPRIHRMFSNLKTWLAGTHHGIGAKNVPTYLREFEFRFNRRRVPMAAFQTLLGLTSSHPPQPVRRRRASRS
jgi:transposase-like protein